MLKYLLPTIFLTFFLSLFSSNIFADDQLNIVQLKGKAFAFYGSNEKPTPLKIGQNIRPGTLIATAANSHLTLGDKARHFLIVGEESRLIFRAQSPNGLKFLSLLKGRIHHAPQSGSELGPSNKLISIIGSKQGFIGQEYTLTYTKMEKGITVHEGKFYKVNLSKKSSGNLVSSVDLDDEDSEEEEEEDNEEEDLEEEVITKNEVDELSEDATTLAYLKKLEAQDNLESLYDGEKIPIKKEKTQIDIRFISRFIKYQQTQVTDFSGIDLNLDDVDIPTQFRDRIQDGSIDEYTYEFRLEWNLKKKFGDADFFSSGSFEYGSEDDLYDNPFQIINTRKTGRNYIELNEIYLLNSWDDYDLTFGKKVYKLGFAFLYSPTDRITPKDFFDPLDTRDIGNWLLQYDKYIYGHTFSYVLIPYFAPNKGTQSTGIRLEVADDDTQSEIGRVRETKTIYPDLALKNFNNLFLIKGTKSGYDYYAGMLYGPSIYPINSEEIETQTAFEEYPKVTNFLLGFTKNISSTNIYTDAIYQRPEGQKDDTYFSFTSGFKYKHTWLANLLRFKHFDFIVEYSKEKIQRHQRGVSTSDLTLDMGKTPTRSSESSRPNKNNLLGRFTFKWSDTLDFTFSFSKSLDSPKLLRVYGTEYSPIDGLFIRFHYESYRFNVNLRTAQLLQFGFDPNAEVTEEFDRFTLKSIYTF